MLVRALRGTIDLLGSDNRVLAAGTCDVVVAIEHKNLLAHEDGECVRAEICCACDGVHIKVTIPLSRPGTNMRKGDSITLQ